MTRHPAIHHHQQVNIMTDAPVTQVHELITYKSIDRRLDRLSEGMNIETRGPLIDALDRLSCTPFLSFPTRDGEYIRFAIGGEEAGTFCDPKVDVILKHSKPSPFGRGEETVVDVTYRCGHEVTAADITFPAEYLHKSFTSDLENSVSKTLFVARQAKVKLYKLTIYREGGHFDWHVDTTHSDSHHATILVALNTSWTGGDFILRRNGVETRMDMKPMIEPESPEYKPCVNLAVVAFYTDTEHKVEPITDGVRIVLQYDVEVEGWVTKKEAQDEHIHKKHKATHLGDDDNEEGSPLDNHRTYYKERQAVLHESVHMGDPAVIDEIVNIIERLLSDENEDAPDQVAFALQYLYRKSSIIPEYLKGSDSLLYQALSKTLDVSLHPVVLHERSDYEGFYQTSEADLAAYIFPHTLDEGSNDEGSDSSDEGSRYRRWPKREERDGIFHLPHSTAIRHISRRGYVARAGNEAILGEGKYFGGGMFVELKDADDTEDDSE